MAGYSGLDNLRNIPDMREITYDQWQEYNPEGTQEEYEDWQYNFLSTEEQIDTTIASIDDPFGIDWETGIVTDESGEVIKDYGDLYADLDEARTTEIPGLDTWMTDQGYDFYDPMARDDTEQFLDPTMQAMQAMIDQLTTGPTPMELGQAIDYAAQSSGKTRQEYDAYMANLERLGDQEIGAFAGMTDEERALRERSNRNEMRGMEERASRMINNIQASTGSASRSYAAADQAISQINDVQIQQDLAIYNDDYMRKTQESDKAMQRYQMAVQNGQMSQGQYLDILQQNKSLAFQGYATQVNTMMQQNQQYLQQYGADLQAIGMNIDNIYKGINAEIGIDAAMMDFVSEQYDMAMAPVLFELNNLYAQLQQEKADEAADQATLFGWLGLGVALLAIPFSLPVAAAVGAGAALTGITGDVSYGDVYAS